MSTPSKQSTGTSLTAHTRFNERFVVLVFLGILSTYIVWYGYAVTSGFVWSAIGWGVLLMLVPILLIDSLKTVVEVAGGRSFHSGTEETEKISIIIPCHNGSETLGYTLMDLLKRFQPEQIIVASNGSSDASTTVTRDYGVQLLNIPEAVGKVEAINRALALVRTEYTLVLDDDVLIGDAVIPTKPLGSTYSGVAFKIYPVVTNWLTKIQDYEYRKSMDLGRGFHSKHATVQNISGAIGLFRTDELLRQIHVHTGEFSGEDLQRTLLIHLTKGNTGVVMSDFEVRTLVPETFRSLFNQRVYGWNPGFYANLGNYLRILCSRHTPLYLKYEAFYCVFLVVILDALRIAALPIIFFYPTTVLVLYATYLLFEVVPYASLKVRPRPPLWILFIMPLFGLFGFITRVSAFVVFMYRRIVVKVSRQIRLDDYRRAGTGYRLVSSFATLLFAVSLLATSFNVAPRTTQARPDYRSIEPSHTIPDVQLETIIIEHATFTHTVKEGETADSIAKLYFGDGATWTAINTSHIPTQIRAGVVVALRKS